MKVSSFIRMGQDLAPVEVELSLTPGLPQFHFLGLPDTALKESVLRIRSALREQDFNLPQAHQILVHLRPTHLKKSSRGLDLAVAAALLWETGQIERPSGNELPVLYGELTLKGEVFQPDDIDGISSLTGKLYTGTGLGLPFDTLQIEALKDIATPTHVAADHRPHVWKRPVAKTASLTKSAAEVARVIAAGEHSTLFAGPPGSGKSTLCELIPSWIENPNDEETLPVLRVWRQSGRELNWRPVLRPHHSMTPLSMIGGGSSLWAGEITRAHTGVLIMDELLKFHVEIQEALREPIESGVICLVRGGRAKTYPARVLLLATTNLCNCGNFVPRRSSRKCRCAKPVIRRTLTRLTGPFVDRFAIVQMTDEWAKDKENETVSCDSIAEDVMRAIAFRKSQRRQTVPNSRLLPEDIDETLNVFQREQLLSCGGRSRRRRASVLRVARTLADLRSGVKISNQDIETAVRLSVETHRQLEEWQD